MSERGFKNHPYIPNSVPEVQQEMLRELGLKDLDELHSGIPEELKLKEGIKLPKPLRSEHELRKHVQGLLNRNSTCEEKLNFMGAGCWQHYVPAVCDEINRRAEFLTAYAGEAYEDYGRFKALFEYESLVAELVEMDVVNVPAIDWAQAAATSIRMACRMTGRQTVLIPRILDRDKYMIIKNYCSPDISFVEVDYKRETGELDMADLESKLGSHIAAVYFENPSFLGFIETQGDRISALAHKHGAECIVGVDPSSLGVLEVPANYGADIVCGELQPLGMHMNYGGGQAGFIATRDEERYVMEYPSRLFGIAPTVVEGEYGFGDVAYERTSFALREKGKEYVGTQAGLWGITAGVYLALMGPLGMKELGQSIMQKSQYAVKQLSGLQGVKGSLFKGCNFKEFVVDFNGTGKTVEQINRQLLLKDIFGGKDLSGDFPELGQCALYCITEVCAKADIDRLAEALKEIIK